MRKPTRKTDNTTLVKALRILAHDIKSPDCVPMLCILEGADRIEELVAENEELKATQTINLTGNVEHR